MGCVYRIVNRRDRRSYVGQTIHTLEHRMKGHLCNGKYGRGYLGRAMKKHGVEAFSWYVLVECSDGELDTLEQFYIAYFNANRKKGGHGYNLDDGGSSHRGHVHDADTRVQMKQSRASFLNSAHGIEYLEQFSVTMKQLWSDPRYRVKNMVQSPVSREQLTEDGSVMHWDDIASKYSVSPTTVKKWFVHHGIIKPHVKQQRSQWTTSEEERLLSLYDAGALVRAIASALGRSECSVKKRVQLLCNARGIARNRYRRTS